MKHNKIRISDIGVFNISKDRKVSKAGNCDIVKTNGKSVFLQLDDCYKIEKEMRDFYRKHRTLFIKFKVDGIRYHEIYILKKFMAEKVEFFETRNHALLLLKNRDKTIKFPDLSDIIFACSRNELHKIAQELASMKRSKEAQATALQIMLSRHY